MIPADLVAFIDAATDLRGLGVWQPHAFAISDLDKRTENRENPRSLTYRGPVLIHASKRYRREEFSEAVDDVIDRRPGSIKASVPGLATWSERWCPSPDLPFGALVARAKLVAIRPNGKDGHVFPPGNGACKACGRWSGVCPKADPWAIPGQHGLILEDVAKLPVPVPWGAADQRCMQGLFRIDRARLREKLERLLEWSAA